MGSGSTIAAAEAIGNESFGLELDAEYFQLAQKSIPRLAALYPSFEGREIEVELNDNVEYESELRTAFVLAEKSPAYRIGRTAKRK